MTDFVRIALVGTARGSEPHAPTGTSLDDLLAGLSGTSAERRLLLAGGAWAVYRQAGYAADARVAAPEPCPGDALPVCSPAIARLLADLLTERDVDLLVEALELLTAAGRRLPPPLLPAALAVRAVKLRPLIGPLLGERGRWLAAQNPEWDWAIGLLPANEGLPADAERIWDEGASEERLEVLRRLRLVDAERAREWIAGVWKGEKADLRVSLLETLATALSPDDEPFLESALDDRSSSVRSRAANLLTRLPESRLVARMTRRADDLVSYGPELPATARLKAFAKALVGRPSAAGQLTLYVPKELDPAWQRDVAELKAAGEGGERAWWLEQTLAAVPPRHWSDRFGVPPAELVASARDNLWEAPLLRGWVRATIAFGAADWALPLWERQVERDANGNGSPGGLELPGRLLQVAPRAAVERWVVAFLEAADADQEQRLGAVLDALPRPWDVHLSEVYLARMRQLLSKTESFQQRSLYWWLGTLAGAALALPPTGFARALEPWSLPEEDSYTLQQARREVGQFTGRVAIRQQLHEELG